MYYKITPLRMYCIRSRSVLCFILTIASIKVFLVTSSELNASKYNESSHESTDIITADPYTKKILFWNSFYGRDDFYFGFGYEPFTRHNCDVRECFITNQRGLMPIDKFDAIIFHGPKIYEEKQTFPSLRTPSQRYIYFSKESPFNCYTNTSLNGIFNWTISHRLDADIVYPYFTFVDRERNLVAPAENPEWEEQPEEVYEVEEYLDPFSKRGHAVWLVSKCVTPNKREVYVKELQAHGIGIDIFGACGNYHCGKNKKLECLQSIRNKYYFYIAFENSHCKDYMSEKVFHAIKSKAIPVLFGGANLDRFLPPGSYLDATKHSPQELAAKMMHLMAHPNDYMAYFWWKRFYKCVVPVSPFCDLCRMLYHNATQPKKYAELHEWWVGNRTNPICPPKANS